MPSTANPFGLRPVEGPAGAIRQRAYTIASGYATSLYKFGAVNLASDGTIVAATAGDTNKVLGVFLGCEYTDSAGKRQISPYWPASTTATEIVAYVCDDPDQIYLVQNAGSVAQTNIGNHCQIVAGTGSTITGISNAAASNTMGTTASQLIIIGFDGAPDNAIGDSYTNILVRLGTHPFRALNQAGV